jgi:uncharacterized protein (TIGR02231 family)
MKTRIITSLAAILLAFPLIASDQVGVTSQIKEVTVFLQGAQISRQARINITKGTSTLIFRDLPAGIDPQSIQAKGEGNFVILSLQALQDTLKMLENQLAEVGGKQAVMKSEEELLVANRNLGGNDRTITMAELKLAADFYRSRLTEIKMAQIKLSAETGKLTEKIEKVRNQLSTMDVNKPTSEILVNISAEEAAAVTLWMTYTVNDAGWYPEYDIRAKDVQNPVQLSYNAKVYQNTGEDWKKVSISLSTANPQQQGEKPVLQPWFIDFEPQVVPLTQYAPRSVEKKMAYAAPVVVEEMADEAAPAATTAATLTNVSENQTNFEFNIKVPYDIPSDNKQYTINIQENSLPATYEYYCAPKIDREAFLLARITGWENLNLLSGEINLFFEGTYVGKSTLNIRNTKDTLDLSLGRDKGIVVTRTKLKDFTEQKTIGSNIRETRTWEVTVRNSKKQALNLRIEDQFPISMNKDIVIESQEYSGAVYDKESGKVVWKMNLAPSEEQKLRLSFAIKYPKDKRVFVD